jgi:hypothetical protein
MYDDSLIRVIAFLQIDPHTNKVVATLTNRGQALSPLATGRCGCVTVTATPPG